MRIVLALALVACAVEDAAMSHDPYDMGWRIGLATLLFGIVAVPGLLEYFGRRRRDEPGIIDLRTIFRSRELWGAAILIAVLVVGLRQSAYPFREGLRTMGWQGLFILSLVGRRGYWDPIPPFLPTPCDERVTAP